jgi:hypothetical protein
MGSVSSLRTISISHLVRLRSSSRGACRRWHPNRWNGAGTMPSPDLCSIYNKARRLFEKPSGFGATVAFDTTPEARCKCYKQLTEYLLIRSDSDSSRECSKLPCTITPRLQGMHAPFLLDTDRAGSYSLSRSEKQIRHRSFLLRIREAPHEYCWEERCHTTNRRQP